MKLKRKCMGKRVQWGISLLLIFPYLFVGCGFVKDAEQIALVSESTEAEQTAVSSTQENATTTAETASQTVCVYVCGAVLSDGVYHLPQGARVVDAIAAAGGCTKKADAEQLNQAEFVTDGQRLYVPRKDEATTTQAADGESSGGAGETGKINLNTATKEELMTLPGVGESKANAILEYRQEHGAFQSVEEIKQISGIKDGVYNRIKNSIIVG